MTVQFLGKRTGHQAVTQVDDQLCHSHFHKGRTGSNDPQACKLTCAGQVGKREDYGFQSGKSGPFCHNAKGKGNCQITKSNGNTIF